MEENTENIPQTAQGKNHEERGPQRTTNDKEKRDVRALSREAVVRQRGQQSRTKRR